MTTLMKKTHELHRLIHALTPSERRYVKRFAQTSGKGKRANYLALFDAIARQPDYDEAALLQLFQGRTIGRHFAEAKYYLHKVILKSLQAYHANDKSELRIYRCLATAKILSDKGLYVQAAKQYRQARAMANKLQLFTLLPAIAENELKLNESINQLTMSRSRKQRHRDEIDSYNELVRKESGYTELHRSVNDLLLRVGPAGSEAEHQSYLSVLNHPLLRESAIGGSLRLLLHAHFIRAKCLKGLSRGADAIAALEEVLTRLDKNSSDSSRYIHWRRGGLSSLCKMHLSLYQFDRLALRLQELSQTLADEAGSALSGDNKIDCELLTAGLHAARGDFRQSLQTLEGIRHSVETKEGTTIIGLRYRLYSALFHAYYGCGDLRAALACLQQAHTMLAGSDCLYWRRRIRMMMLLVHYDLQDFDLLEFLLAATEKSLTGSEGAARLDLEFVQFLTRLLRAQSQAEERGLVQAVREDLARRLPLEAGQPAVRVEFHILAWLDMHAGGKHYAQTVREQGWEMYQAREGGAAVIQTAIGPA